MTQSSADDESLLSSEQFRAALEKMYQEHQEDYRKYVLRVCDGIDEDVDDIIHEWFAETLKKIPKIRQSLRAYGYQSIRYNSRRHVRRKRREQGELKILRQFTKTAAEVTLYDAWTDGEVTAIAKKVLNEEEMRLVRSLFYVNQEPTTEDLAISFGCSSATMRKRKQRVLDKLRYAFEEYLKIRG